MSLQPPINGKHALFCETVTAVLVTRLPLLYKVIVSVRIVGDSEGTHLAGCVIEVGRDVYEVEIRSLEGLSVRGE